MSGSMATILIVDDDPAGRGYLTTVLGMHGHRLLEASDGGQALHTVHAEHPDLVLCDVVLPTIDGYEFVRQLRSDPGVAGTRVILHSGAFRPQEGKALARACGVDRLLAKPSAPADVLRAVEEVLAGPPADGLAPPPEFDREHLRLVTDKLVQKVADLDSANARLRAATLEQARLIEQVQAGRERMRALSHQLLQAQEAERRHIARELHDEIGQTLTAVKLNLQSVKQIFPRQVPRLDESIGVVERALQQVRDLSLDLRPSILDDLGLVPALSWYLDRQAKRAGFVAQLVAAPLAVSLAPDIQIACFRIAQEAVTNVARHARARQVRVELCQQGEELLLTVRDDGIGFDVTAARERATRGGSLGLLGMQERASLLGGEVQVHSEPRHGTEVRARLPLGVASRLERRNAGRPIS